MKNLTWQNPEQLFVAQVLINKVKSKCCGIKVNKIKSAIIKEKSIKDYELLKELSGGHLKKEDIFYGLLMNEYHPNDTTYKDLRNVLVEIYNIPPKDTITLMWVKKLDDMYKKNK